jgi:hypothetical protein
MKSSSSDISTSELLVGLAGARTERCHPAGGKDCDLPDDCEAIVKDAIFQGYVQAVR